MKDFGKFKNYLGIDIENDRENKLMSFIQTKYIELISEKYNIIENKNYWTPIEIN